ncbi:MAG: nucleoside monophosphate kinase [Candidatus Bathyarchaeota archaeon]|nr:nucleoside monophosphate kinase [Candidatus Bathyarchaeota archaeon]
MGVNLVIFGPPGSGKGTYASRLQLKLGIPTIATGDMLRGIARQKSKLAKTVKDCMSTGELVPDGIVIHILKERLARDDCRKGFILDGFPRTIGQAGALDEITEVDAIILLHVPEWVLVERLSSRRVCRRCGEVFNILYLKPREEGVCDECGGELYQRMDDTPRVVKDRLKVYEKQTEPLIRHYKGKLPFVEFRCEKLEVPPEVAVEEILKELEKLRLR